MAWWIVKSMGKEILFALVLCIISIPIAPNLAKQILPEILLPVLGISVSVFTAFRNTQAYNRWWEARTLWGGLVNGSRNWRNGLLALLPNDSDRIAELNKLLGLQVLLVWTLNGELRGSYHPTCAPKIDDLRQQLGLGKNSSSQDLLQLLSAELLKLCDLGRIDGLGRLNLLNVQE
ncbi:MAG TPA: hypothetical protein DEB19_03230, partial [Synechococcales bacterium UBA8138]|nr:hypothetical protein [Synechococcales bacterium UBA8138]